MKKIGVVGAGIMGSGIAQRCATYSSQVVLVDSQPEQLRAAEKRIGESLDKLVKKGAVSENQKALVLGNIQLREKLDDLADCDLVIEAVTENRALKESVFAELDRLCKPECILASNTSSIPLKLLAGVTGRPDKVLGLHFMNPVPVIPLVELIRAERTSDASVFVCREWLTTLQSEVVESCDSPGFIINRILIPMINEAVGVLADGVANVQDIDKAMVVGTRQPMGPLALADLIGLDTVLFILQTLHAELKDERYRPCPLLEEYVRDNRLGRKTGRGFHDYS